MTLMFLISTIRKKRSPRAGVVEAEAVTAVAEGEEVRLSENSAAVAAAQSGAVAGSDRA